VQQCEASRALQPQDSISTGMLQGYSESVRILSRHCCHQIFVSCICCLEVLAEEGYQDLIPQALARLQQQQQQQQGADQ
jgi:hypothetical protein